MKYRTFLSAAIVAMAICPAGAHAQATASPDEPAASDDGLQTIVVTAERREENLQDVPIAATAVTGQQLEDKAVVRVADLQNIAPSLSVTDSGLTQSVNIRGIGIADGNPSVANGVAVYVNGVFQPPVLTTSSFYDVSNVEVLRGPQGTLVGSNSTGGAIFINTTAPSPDRVEGYLQGSYGNFDHVTLQGAVNIPLTDTLAVRAAGNFDKRDSYYIDIGPLHNEAGRLNEKAGRLSVLWNPGSFKATGHLEWIDHQTGGYAYRPIPGTPYAAGRVGDIWTLDYDSPTLNHEKGFLSDAELRYDFGGVTLRSLTAYTYKRIRNLYDSDATELPPPSTEDQFTSEREIVQEVNLISPTTGKLNWIVGGYYQHNKILVDILQSAGSPVDPTHVYIWDYKTTLGAFAQSGYHLSDQFEIQLGVRYSHYAVTQTGSVAIGYGTVFGPTGLQVTDLANTHEDGRVTGKLALNWTPNQDNLIYAFAARGYKPGGANSATSQFGPETVWDYELGWKSTMLGGHLRTQLGGFYMDYHDFQFSLIDTTSGQPGVANIPHAKIYGLEGQVQAKFCPLAFDGGFAYVHSRLQELIAVNGNLIPPGTTLGPQCGGMPTSGCFDYTDYLQSAGGGPNLFSPKWSYNFGASYRFDVSSAASLTPRINYAYVGPQYTNLFYSPVTDYLKGRGLLSAQLTLDLGRWSVEAYGTNLTDEKYVSGHSGNNEFYGAPREYGVRASVRF